MLALQTDMSIPKDVNRIMVQVLVGDKLQHQQTYPVAPEPNGSKLPATLAIVAGDDPNPTVQVRVVGIREEGDDTEARTFAKVVTTVPTSRIATLRVPIQWLCDGTARADGEEYASTCDPTGDGEDVEDERACVAGECKSVVVDSLLLPDYQPEDIFGGDTGPDGFSGKCFDTETCFDQGFEVVPTDDCELDLDVPEGSGVNVALQFPREVEGEDGTGICGEVACYVPLDQDPTYGWSVAGSGSGVGGEGNEDTEDGEGGEGVVGGGPTTVKLPPAVCARVADGTAESVRVSYACPTKTPKYPTCGPWSTGDEPQDGSGGATSAGPSTTTGGNGGSTPGGECESLTGDSIDTGDPDVDQYVSAVRQLATVVEQYREMAEVACAGLSHQAVVGDVDADELVALCGDAAAEVGTLLSESALNAVLAEGYCVSDMPAQQTCEESCGVTSACGDDQDFRCSQVVGDCEGEGGSCQDGCYGDSEAPTTCAGNCYGECTGSCSERCVLADGSVAVEGCSGLCQGICTGECAGNCKNSESCDTTCLATEPADVCGGNGANVTCRPPLSTEECAEDLCAVSCETAAVATRACKVSIVSTYLSSTGEGQPISDADRQLLETHGGPLSDVVLQTRDFDATLAHLTTGVSALGEQLQDDPDSLDPEAAVCFSAAVQLQGDAIRTLQAATNAAVSVVNAYSFVDVSSGGSGGAGSTGLTGSTTSSANGGTGGVPPVETTSGGSSAGGSSAGGTGECSFTVCTSDADCGSGTCPLGSCNVGLTTCEDAGDCPEDFCDNFFCSVSGTPCEDDGPCYGPDTCSPRLCDCDGPSSGGSGGTGGLGGTSTTGPSIGGTGFGGTGGGGGVPPTGGFGGTSEGSGGVGASGGTAGTGGAGGTSGTGGTGGVSGAGGTGGVSGGGGTGGGGGTAGFGGSSGGFGGNGASGGSGGGGGAVNCGWGADPDSCEICLLELCCAESTECEQDAVCGPVTDPGSELQCMVACQGGYAGAAPACEEGCGTAGVIADTTRALLECGSSCPDCTPPVGMR